MRLASLVREVVDQRVRPGQRGGATVAGSLPDREMGRRARCVLLTRDATGSVRAAGCYTRGRYGQAGYVDAGW